MRGRLLLGALLPLLAVLAACNVPGSDRGGGSDPPATGAGPPAGFTTRTLGPVSFAAPQTWQPTTAPAAANVEQLALRAPAPEGTFAAVALALFQAQPPRGAAQEADSLLRIKRDVQRAQNARSQTLSLPGFTLAMLVSYDEPGPTGDLVRTEQLVGDLTGGGLFVLTVKGSQDSFDEEELPAIARSATASG